MTQGKVRRRGGKQVGTGGAERERKEEGGGFRLEDKVGGGEGRKMNLC